MLRQFPAHALHNLALRRSNQTFPSQNRGMVRMGLILLIILIILLLGAVPAWPYSRSWGYGPSGGLGLLVLIVIILLVLRVF